MEDELKCSYCHEFYTNPVLLPCFHSLCYACALNLQEKFLNANSSLNTSLCIKQQSLSSSASSTSSSSSSSSASSCSSTTNTMTNAFAQAAKSIMSLSSPNHTLHQFNLPTPPSSVSSSHHHHQSISPISSSSQMDRSSLSITDLGSSIVSDLDKLSVFSETDSGVAMSHTNSTTTPSSTTTSSLYHNSRPSSYLVDSQSMKSHKMSTTLSARDLMPLPPPLPASTLYSTYLQCPTCNRMIYMDETGVDSLSKNTCLQNIVERYTESKKLTIKCQMCPSPSLLSSNKTVLEQTHEHAHTPSKDAVVMCEQCEIYYCEDCRESCHPMRGPLVKHTLVAPKYGRDLVNRRNRQRESKCTDHMTETCTVYCLICKTACCNLCLSETSAHLNHQIQPINNFSKSQKAELSQVLQKISEKAKVATEFLTKLKTLPELIEENSLQIKQLLSNEIDELIKQLELKKKELVDGVDVETANKKKSINNQVQFMSTKIQKTTGLLQFCVETLKEQDASSFLQISENLINRMSDIDCKFPQDADLQPKCELETDFMLNTESIYKEIRKLNYKQIKLPNCPSFIAEECVNSSNDSIILRWHQKSNAKNVQGYVLEVDDGTPDGPFKQVYCGSDSICQVNGLSALSTYNARVKAFNQAGFSEYSPIISLAASPTLWFSFNPKSSHSDALFTNNFMTATCISFEERVILGSIGFSSGVHYWEVTIDRYDNHPDPAFGIAKYDVAKEHMLGKDNKSWCMYIDSKRSWFMHNGKHVNRIDRGIEQGCVVGVLLDLNNFSLSFYLNDEPHGSSMIAFSKLPKGVYYPAFSLNKNVEITVNSGLEPPLCMDSADSD